ncbi:type II CAAX prenyl endopeptidase Rce1 family protein [Nanoarchaeota archaeon]
MKSLLILLVISTLLSEIILQLNPTAGFLIYTLLITGCLLALSKTETLNKEAKLIIIFLIFPVIRILNLFLNLEPFWKTFLIYSVFLFLSTFYILKFKLNPGFIKKYIFLLPLTILLGIYFGFLTNLFLNLDKQIILLIPIIILSEEIFFRGLLQNFAEKNYTIISSILFPAFLYSTLFIYNLPLAFLFFFINIILCLIYTSTKNLYLTFALNFTLHLTIFLV